MQLIDRKNIQNFESIPVDEFWNVGTETELKMHSIHAYPAKFPAFLTKKALQYSNDLGVKPEVIADIFCGCGTVAYEAKREEIDFWGCDLNPVATMIARAKSAQYSEKKLRLIYKNIINSLKEIELDNNAYKVANKRLIYWYYEEQFLDLLKLKIAIYREVNKHPRKYHDFFACAFSNILKPCSKWLTKSIKPQVDPNKNIANAYPAFENQFSKMLKAYLERPIHSNAKIDIHTGNFLNIYKKAQSIDMIITSPPYVTSYEYADLHQLSSLWLDYTNDYRELREGSIGSTQIEYDFDYKVKDLNLTATRIVSQLSKKSKSQAKAVGKYYLDMQNVAQRCYDILSEQSVALFVIGNTEYRDTRIENAEHLTESLYDAGFKSISVSKRAITNKFLTPYRDQNGRFSSDKSARKIYSEEFIVFATKG